MLITYDAQSNARLKGFFDYEAKGNLDSATTPMGYIQEISTEQGTAITWEFQRALRGAATPESPLLFSFDGNYLSGKVLVADNDQTGEDKVTQVFPDNARVRRIWADLMTSPGIFPSHEDQGMREFAGLTRFAEYEGLIPWSLAPRDNLIFLRLRNDGTVAFSTNEQKVKYYNGLYQSRIRLQKTSSQNKIDDIHDAEMTSAIWLERALPDAERGFKAVIPPAQYQSKVVDINPQTMMSSIQEEYFTWASETYGLKKDNAQRQRENRTQQELDRLEEDDTLTIEQEQQLIADYEGILAGVKARSINTRGRRKTRRA